MPALFSIFGGLLKGASGEAGTQSLFQLEAAQQVADKAAANQRLLVYIGGGLLAAAAVGGVIYYVVRK